MPELPSLPIGADPSFISLKEYVDTRLLAIEERVDAHFVALEKSVATALNSQATAITKAEQATEYRLAAMNEFRKTVEDQSVKQATKIELDALRSTLVANIDTVRVEASARSEANRLAADIEAKAMWRVIYGLATAVAVIEAILKFSPIK